eukprot:NODE_1288_length_1021_cov_111.407407_g989_i0.p1 GENE.NODE_1288_length_1021_cov_111.407407_g989_i0~~NODE_1288_length_1021_cov_111.407407_g989_i0.p1  ORF type:complete len:305 (+),score=40.15 NODE_1288_length_1021_cov_111.407407_g989_i0:71-985(+)
MDGAATQNDALKQVHATWATVQASTSSTWLQCTEWRKSMLTRILVARDWNVKKASEMLENVTKWRAAYGTDGLPFLPLPADWCRGYSDSDLLVGYTRRLRDAGDEHEQNLQAIRKRYSGTWHKWDKEGHPVYIERTGQTDPWDIMQIPPEIQIRSHVLIMELGEHLCKHQSRKVSKDISQATIICDMAGYNIKKLACRPALDLFKQITDIDKNYYPENLRKAVVVNSPSIMSVVWRVVRPWLDPRTASKVKMHGSKYQNELLELIDAEHLPKFLGGTCECVGGCVPEIEAERLNNYCKDLSSRV